MKLDRPDYEALDSQGYPYVRKARIIDELPTPELRKTACTEATEAIGQLLGLRALSTISFGVPVYTAFMSAPDAKKHPQRELLQTRGCDLSLDFCATYS